MAASMTSVRSTIVGAIVGAAFWYLVAGSTGLIIGLVLGTIVGFIADRRQASR